MTQAVHINALTRTGAGFREVWNEHGQTSRPRGQYRFTRGTGRLFGTAFRIDTPADLAETRDALTTALPRALATAAREAFVVDVRVDLTSRQRGDALRTSIRTALEPIATWWRPETFCGPTLFNHEATSSYTRERTTRSRWDVAGAVSGAALFWDLCFCLVAPRPMAAVGAGLFAAMIGCFTMGERSFPLELPTAPPDSSAISLPAKQRFAIDVWLNHHPLIRIARNDGAYDVGYQHFYDHPAFSPTLTLLPTR